MAQTKTELRRREVSLQSSPQVLVPFICLICSGIFLLVLGITIFWIDFILAFLVWRRYRVGYLASIIYSGYSIYLFVTGIFPALPTFSIPLLRDFWTVVFLGAIVVRSLVIAFSILGIKSVYEFDNLKKIGAFSQSAVRDLFSSDEGQHSTIT